ncbi:response regulator [Maricaulis sp.]|uniref:response regulator n=1 Tax=Maricaulis sp. TaxID=1486257 RepID=UPI003A8D02C6
MSQGVPIILIDDDPDEHFLFRTDLEDAGFDLDFESFTHPEEALAHLYRRAGGPVLVLTDMGLAGDDPIEFIKLASKVLHGGAIGAFSGALNPDKEARCREAGSSFYIVKPISGEKLEAALANTQAMGIEVQANGRRRLVCR